MTHKFLLAISIFTLSYYYSFSQHLIGKKYISLVDNFQSNGYKVSPYNLGKNGLDISVNFPDCEMIIGFDKDSVSILAYIIPNDKKAMNETIETLNRDFVKINHNKWENYFDQGVEIYALVLENEKIYFRVYSEINLNDVQIELGNKYWAEIYKCINRKIDLINSIMVQYNKLDSSNKYKLILNEIENNISKLQKSVFSEFKSIDESSLLSICQNHSNLSASFGVLLIQDNIENLIDSNKDFRDLILHFEGLENRFAVARKEYNDYVDKIGKKDLIYPFCYDKTKVPEVSFD